MFSSCYHEHSALCQTRISGPVGPLILVTYAFTNFKGLIAFLKHLTSAICKLILIWILNIISLSNIFNNLILKEKDWHIPPYDSLSCLQLMKDGKCTFIPKWNYVLINDLQLAERKVLHTNHKGYIKLM